MFTEQQPDLLDYGNNLPGHVYLVGDMDDLFDIQMQSLTKEPWTNLRLHNVVQDISKHNHKYGRMMYVDCVVVRPDDDIHSKSTSTNTQE